MSRASENVVVDRAAGTRRPAHSSPLLTEPEVLEMLGISERKMRSMKAAKQFPQPVVLPGGRLIRYRRGDVDAWIEALPVKAG